MQSSLASKMRRRILILRIEGPLYMLMLLLVSLLVQDHHSSARQVSGNLVIQQQQQTGGNNSNSLPALSERANVANSRYLSAASTASLAAATAAAAANGGPSQNGVQATASSNNNNNANNIQQQQDANRNFLTHQQLQQQQHQQQAAAVGGLPAPANAGSQLQANQIVANTGQANQQAQAIGTNGNGGQPSGQNQAPQFNSAQAQQVGAGTPVMSTTYTFNPITGQFVPSDLSTGLLPSAQSALSQGVYNYNNNNNQQQQLIGNPLPPTQVGINQNSLPFNPFAQQQQQPTRFPVGQQGFGLGQQQQPIVPQLAVSGQYPHSGIGGLNLNQIINQQRQISQQQFNRRNGYSSSSSQRLNPAYNHNHQVEDDSGFLQQQQQLQSSNLLGGDSSGGFGFDSAYGNLPVTSYLTGGSHQNSQQPSYNDQQHSISSQSSSVSAAPILPTPTTSFGTAFVGPLNSQQQFESSSFKTDQCVAADNRHGTCYQASECIRKGGTPMGKCGANSAEFSGSSYVCCIFDVSCGQFAAERFVYFRNPNYPNTYDQSRMCRAKIGKLDKGVCQFRLDLLRFDVAKPTNGNCSSDMFVVSGQNENYVIPKICGLNDGQHYYVGVDESGVITLHMMMMGFYRRQFEILITQIPCRSDYAAPAHCLQYFMGTHGTIKSFNYDDEHLTSQQQLNYDLLQQSNQPQQQQQQLQIQDGNAASFGQGPTAPYGLQFHIGNGQLQQRQQLGFGPSTLLRWGGAGGVGPAYVGGQPEQHYGGYPNDLDYTMCIRKESGFCSITYQLSRGEQGLQPFAVGQSQLFGANDSSWHSVSSECRDDYLLIGGIRLCSSTSASSYSDQGGISSIQFAQNGSVLSSSAPFLSGQQSTAQLQQQLQNQHALLLQQLARLQQQQQEQAASSGNVTYVNAPLNGNNNSAGQPQIGNNNLEQQQAAILQQTMLIQQQLSALANINSNFVNQQQQQNNRFQQQQQLDGQYSDSQGGTIITDTTSGPFILRFVSNMARNARGFHIDYRQNPCK